MRADEMRVRRVAKPGGRREERLRHTALWHCARSGRDTAAGDRRLGVLREGRGVHASRSLERRMRQ